MAASSGQRQSKDRTTEVRCQKGSSSGVGCGQEGDPSQQSMSNWRHEDLFTLPSTCISMILLGTFCSQTKNSQVGRGTI